MQKLAEVDQYLEFHSKMAAETAGKRDELVGALTKLAYEFDADYMDNAGVPGASAAGATNVGKTVDKAIHDQRLAPRMAAAKARGKKQAVFNLLKLLGVGGAAGGVGLYGRDQINKYNDAKQLEADGLYGQKAPVNGELAAKNLQEKRLTNAGIGGLAGAAGGGLLNYLTTGDVLPGAIGGGLAGGAAGAFSPELKALLSRVG